VLYLIPVGALSKNTDIIYDTLTKRAAEIQLLSPHPIARHINENEF